MTPPGDAEEPATHTAQTSRHTLPIALVALLGLTLSVTVFREVRDGERNGVLQEFEWRARSHADSLAATLARYEDALATLRNLFTSSDEVTFGEFRSTAADLLARTPGIDALQWAPLVLEAQRAAFEAEAREKVANGFTIRGESAPVEVAPAYLPIYYREPVQAESFGVDQWQGPHRALLQRAVESGQPAATPRLPLGNDESSGHGWMTFLPFYGPGSLPHAPAERTAKLRGFLIGTYRFTDLIARSLEQTPHGALELLLVDESPGAADGFLAVHSATPDAPAPDAAEFRRGPHRAGPLLVAGRRWKIYSRPGAAWLNAQNHGYSFAFLAGGILLTGAVTTALIQAQRNTHLVQRLVAERTRELRETQAALREDIRARDATEQALRASEERYRAFIAQSSEAIWRFEFDVPLNPKTPKDEQVEHIHRHARLAECNDALAIMYGYDRAEEIVGMPLSELMPRYDPMNLEHLRDYVENGFRAANSESHEVDREGRSRVFLNNVIGIFENGLLVRSWGTQRDITEQRRAEEQRVANEARLRLAVAAADLGTWEWDLGSHAVVWSESTERIFGVAPGSFDGRTETYVNAIHPDDRANIVAGMKLAVAEGSEIAHEHRIVRPDGSIRWVAARGDVIRDSQGKISRVIGAIMDVTEQRQATEERALIEKKMLETQKLESLGILAGGIAHDFNNLLTGILGNASLARLDLPANSPAQPSLEAIELVAQRAAELCKQMLAYSGRGHFIVQKLDLSQLVEETAELIQISISKSAVLKYSLGRALPAVSADATQIRQIIMNLVINASDAIGEKSGVISISTGLFRADRAYLSGTYLSPQLEEGDYVFLEISDNGCGMSAETTARIFDPFFTTKFTGRGLGLAAVLGIVRGHRGALKVYSEPGRGTTFKLLLPCADGPADELGAAPANLSDWRGSGTVLIVDDEETVRAVSARMIESWGFSTELAAHGREALVKFRADPDRYVAVLLDLTMPQMDGTATFTELRRIRPHVRVLLMSGFNEQDAINGFAGKGLAGFVQKPFQPETLRRKLRSILEPLPAAPI